MPTTGETGQKSFSIASEAGSEWAVVWNRLRASNDGKTEVTLNPIQVGVLCETIQSMMRQSGLSWDRLTMKLFRVCDSCYDPGEPPRPECPVCKGAGSLPVLVAMDKIGGFLGGTVVSCISREVKRQATEDKDDGK